MARQENAREEEEEERQEREWPLRRHKLAEGARERKQRIDEPKSRHRGFTKKNRGRHDLGRKTPQDCRG